MCCVAHSRPPAIDCGRRRTTSTGAVMHEAEQSPIDTWTKNTQPTDCFLWPARRCKAVMPVPADQSICWSCSCVLCPCCPCFSDSAGGWETADEARRLVGRLCTRCARRGGTVGSCARWAAACPRCRPLAPTPAQPTAARRWAPLKSTWLVLRLGSSQRLAWRLPAPGPVWCLCGGANSSARTRTQPAARAGEGLRPTLACAEPRRSCGARDRPAIRATQRA